MGKLLCFFGFHKPFIVCQDGWYERHCMRCQKLLATQEELVNQKIKEILKPSKLAKKAMKKLGIRV